MNWDTIIRHYGIHFRHYTETELDWFRRQPSLEDAVITAARAKDHRGKRYNHQTRITRQALSEAEKALFDQCDSLRDYNSFHELWLCITELLSGVDGLGDLYIYDTIDWNLSTCPSCASLVICA
jgi:hypothetical protein